MSDTQTLDFAASRRVGVGGSDIAAVFNTGWGCRKRLWLDKRGVAPDYPFEETGPIKLGRHLEPFIAHEYCEKTGRACTKEPMLRHPEHPELLVHVDRTIYADERGGLENPGVLEIKAVGRAVFYEYRRTGMPDDYILQLQHGMLVTGRSWGAFAVMNRDNGELCYWDQERDEPICREILAESLAFWGTVENGPMPETLEPDDKRCQRCIYRKSCQGAALMVCESGREMDRDDSLLPLLTEFRERQTLAKEADEMLEETKSELKTLLGTRTAVEVGTAKVYYRPQTAMRWDTKLLDAKHPELAKEFKKPSESRPLRVF